MKPRLLGYGRAVKVLDIAPHEGRSTVWLLDNVPGCHVTVLQTSDDTKVIRNMLHNLSMQQHSNASASVSVLLGGLEKLPPLKHESFDFVYVDSGHDARFTLEAAVQSFNLLKPGGLMVFDDYTTDRLHGYQCPKPAIDAFVSVYSKYLKVFHASWQLMLLKRRNPLRVPPCKSEYYHEDLDKV